MRAEEENRLHHNSRKAVPAGRLNRITFRVLRNSVTTAVRPLRRLQLHPHFVLNVLHTMQSQLLSDPTTAAETISHLRRPRRPLIGTCPKPAASAPRRERPAPRAPVCLRRAAHGAHPAPRRPSPPHGAGQRGWPEHASRPEWEQKAIEEQVGLSTTRTRLRQVYGTHATLRLEPAPDEGTRATITLPLDEERFDHERPASSS